MFKVSIFRSLLNLTSFKPHNYFIDLLQSQYDLYRENTELININNSYTDNLNNLKQGYEKQMNDMTAMIQESERLNKQTSSAYETELESLRETLIMKNSSIFELTNKLKKVESLDVDTSFENRDELYNRMQLSITNKKSLESIESLTKDKQALELLLHTSKNQMNEFQQQADLKQSEIESLQRQIRMERQSFMEEKELIITTITEDCSAKFKYQVNQIEGDLQSVKNELNDVKRQSSMEKQKLSNELTLAGLTIEDAEKERLALIENINKLTVDNDNIRKQCKDLKEELRLNHDEVFNLRNSKLDTEKKFAILKTEAQYLEQELNKQLSTSKKLSSENEEGKAESYRLEQEIQVLKTNLLTAEAKYELERSSSTNNVQKLLEENKKLTILIGDESSSVKSMGVVQRELQSKLTNKQLEFDRLVNNHKTSTDLLQEEINSLIQKNNNCQESISNKENAIKQYELEIFSLKQNISSLQKVLEVEKQYHDKVEEAEQAVHRLTNHLEVSESRLSKKQNELEERLRVTMQERDSLELKYKVAVADSLVKENEINSSKASIQKFKDTLTGNESEIKILDHNLTLVRADLSKVTAERDQLRADSSNASKQLQSDLAKVTAELDQVKVDSSAASKQLQSDLAKVTAERDQLRADSSTASKQLQSEKESLKGEVAVITKKLTISNQVIDTLKSSIARLTADNESLNSEKTKLQYDIDLNEKDGEKVMSSLVSREKELLKLQNELQLYKAASNNTSSLEVTVKSMAVEIESLKSQLESCKNDSSTTSLRQELDTITIRYNDLLKSNEDLRSQHELAEEEYAVAMKKLVETLKQASNTKIEDYKSKLIKAKEKINNLKERINERDLELELFKKQVNDALDAQSSELA